MLFWIFVGCLVLGVVILAVTINYCTAWDDFWENVGAALFAVGLVSTIISLILFCFEYLTKDAWVAGLIEEQKAIVYQLENDVYDNDNDIGKRELMNEVRDWNKKIAKYKANQNNFWVGIYYADVYDQFEMIEWEALE